MDQGIKFQRFIAGDLHETLSKRSNIDLDGVVEPEGFYFIKQLEKRVNRRIKNRKVRGEVLELLKECEEWLLVNQYIKLQSRFRDDLTRVALYGGHQKEQVKVDPFEEMMG